MGNTVQLKKNGQPVFPVTDVSLVMGLQDAIKLPPVKVTTLPTASAETAGKMYYVGPDANDEYERYITSATNGSYEWIDLGDTSIPLPSIADNLTTDDANTALSAKQGKVLNEEIGELEAEVDEKAGVFNDNPEFLEVKKDEDGRIIEAVAMNGEKVIPLLKTNTSTVTDKLIVRGEDVNSIIGKKIHPNIAPFPNSAFSDYLSSLNAFQVQKPDYSIVGSSYLIRVTTQEQFDRVEFLINEAIGQGNTNILVLLDCERLYFRENHFNLIPNTEQNPSAYTNDTSNVNLRISATRGTTIVSAGNDYVLAQNDVINGRAKHDYRKQYSVSICNQEGELVETLVYPKTVQFTYNQLTPTRNWSVVDDEDGFYWGDAVIDNENNDVNTVSPFRKTTKKLATDSTRRYPIVDTQGNTNYRYGYKFLLNEEDRGKTPLFIQVITGFQGNFCKVDAEDANGYIYFHLLEKDYMDSHITTTDNVTYRLVCGEETPITIDDANGKILVDVSKPSVHECLATTFIHIGEAFKTVEVTGLSFVGNRSGYNAPSTVWFSYDIYHRGLINVENNGLPNKTFINATDYGYEHYYFDTVEDLPDASLVPDKAAFVVSAPTVYYYSDGASWTAFPVVSSERKVNVHDCHFSSIKSHILSSNSFGSNILFENNTVDGCFGSILESANTTYNVFAVGNKTRNTALDVRHDGTFTVRGYNSLVKGNCIKNFGAMGIVSGSQGYNLFTGGSQVVIEENILDNDREYLDKCRPFILADSGAINFYIHSRKTVIRNNIVNNYAGNETTNNRGIFIDGYAYNVAVYYNLVTNIYNGLDISFYTIEQNAVWPRNTGNYIGYNIISGKYQFEGLKDYEETNGCKKAPNIFVLSDPYQSEDKRRIIRFVASPEDDYIIPDSEVHENYVRVNKDYLNIIQSVGLSELVLNRVLTDKI